MFKFNLDHSVGPNSGPTIETKEAEPIFDRGVAIQEFIDTHNVVDENNEKIQIIDFTEATAEQLVMADDFEAQLKNIPDETSREFLQDLIRYYRSPTYRDSIPPGGDDNIRDRQIEDPIVHLSVDKDTEGITDAERAQYKELADAVLGNRLRRGNAKLASGYYEEYFSNKDFVDIEFSPETIELAAILKKYFEYEDIDPQKMLQLCQYDIAPDEDLYKIVQYNLEFIKLLFRDITASAQKAEQA